jgi:membrane associated rhomboid family serine protease
MLPYDDGHETRRIPIVTWALIALNVVVFLYELQLSTRGLSRFIVAWGIVPANILTAIGHPTAPGAFAEFFTLISSQFIHAGWLHLIGNMLFLMVFGDDIEETFGSFGFLMFYLLSGVIAGLVQVYAVAPLFGAQLTPSVGASGAIAGVLGAYLVRYPLRRIRVIIPIFILPLPFTLPAFIMIGWWFVQQLFYGVLSVTQTAQTGGVAFWAHIGGFVAGASIMMMWRLGQIEPPTIAAHQ